jgi:hypothetical protein
MRFTVTLVLALATGAVALVSAQARLTPFDGTRQAKAPAVEALYTGPAAAELERRYFIAPQFSTTHRAGRCTLQTFVFTKMSLAEACY